MPENQFEAVMAAIQGLTVKFENRFDKVEAQLVSINGELKGIKHELKGIEHELKRIEHWTPYNANLDVVAKLATITRHK